MSSISRLIIAGARHAKIRHLSTTPLCRKDPWPLPHTPEHLASTTTPTDIPPLPPLPRPNEKTETTRARLLYQSRKRGTLESDLLLSTFAQEKLGDMGAEELRAYDKLLDEPDWDIYYWATNKRTPPESSGLALMSKDSVEHLVNAHSPLHLEAPSGLLNDAVFNIPHQLSRLSISAPYTDMPTTLEIAHWPANEGFAQDKTILKPAGDALTSFEGVQGVWYGQQVEETYMYIAIAWGTMDVHKAFVAGEGNVDKVRPALKRTLAEGARRQLFHGQFDGEGTLNAVLSARITEIGVVTPTAGHGDVVDAILSKLTVLLNEPESPAVGGAFAPIIEKEGAYLLLVGWNSMEDKWAKSLQIMEELLGNAEVTLSHVKFLQQQSV